MNRVECLDGAVPTNCCSCSETKNWYPTGDVAETAAGHLGGCQTEFRVQTCPDGIFLYCELSSEVCDLENVVNVLDVVQCCSELMMGNSQEVGWNDLYTLIFLLMRKKFIQK